MASAVPLEMKKCPQKYFLKSQILYPNNCQQSSLQKTKL